MVGVWTKGVWKALWECAFRIIQFQFEYLCGFCNLDPLVWGLYICIGKWHLRTRPANLIQAQLGNSRFGLTSSTQKIIFFSISGQTGYTISLTHQHHLIPTQPSDLGSGLTSPAWLINKRIGFKLNLCWPYLVGFGLRINLRSATWLINGSEYSSWENFFLS